MKEERSLSQRGCAEGGGRAAVTDGAGGPTVTQSENPQHGSGQGRKPRTRALPLVAPW